MSLSIRYAVLSCPAMAVRRAGQPVFPGEKGGLRISAFCSCRLQAAKSKLYAQYVRIYVVIVSGLLS